MFRSAVVLCAVMLLQAVTVRALLEHSLCRSGSAADGSDGDGSPACVSCVCCPDEALVVARVVIPHPPAPLLHRWHGPELAVAPLPGPDEILHVPEPVVA